MAAATQSILTGDAKEWLTNMIRTAIEASNGAYRNDIFAARFFELLAPGFDLPGTDEIPPQYLMTSVTNDGLGILRLDISKSGAELIIKVVVVVHPDAPNNDRVYEQETAQLRDELVRLPILAPPAATPFEGKFYIVLN